MDSNLVKVPPNIVEQCWRFGERCASGYITGNKPESLYYSTHGIECDPAALAEAKLAECGFCLWLKLDPMVALDWGDKPDDDYDLIYKNKKIDIKQTKMPPHYRRLIWPATKVRTFERKNFDIFVLVKTQEPFCLIAGWVTKERFYREHLVATTADKIMLGNWFMTLDTLNLMKDFILDNFHSIVDDGDWADLFSRLENESPRKNSSAGATAKTYSDQNIEIEAQELASAKRKIQHEKPVEYLCEVCGKSACFGFGVSLLKGIHGRWFCPEHQHLGRKKAATHNI